MSEDGNNEVKQNVELWKMRKLIQNLENARGNGTSMISLIIPPRDQVSRVGKMLADEYGTASNIKSRINRQSVLSAITSTQQKLKLYSRVPNKGLIIYCGTVLTDDGKEKKVTIDFEPFRAINTSLYLCDNKFHVEPLKMLLEDNYKFGFIIVDGSGTLFGTLCGSSKNVLHKFQVELPKKHGRGGQSALRFARLRMEKRHNYIKKVAELSTQFFITNDRPNVHGIVLGGFADFKNELKQNDSFDQRLQEKIIKVVDISYGGEGGFNQAIELSSEVLQNVKFLQEKKLLQKYYNEISLDTGLICYGVENTIMALESGACETLIVWENLEISRFVIRKPETNEQSTIYMTKQQEESGDMLKVETENGIVDLEVVEKVLLVEWLASVYSQYGTQLEFVTDRSQEGSQFVKGFGGIGCILRYKIDTGWHEYAVFDDEYYSDD